MSDLLSAASLLLAVESVLLGLWYGEIASALAVSKPTGDRTRVRRQVSSALYGKALPMALVTVSVGTVFLPDAVRILRESVGILWENSFVAWQFYDAVLAAFCLVVTLLLALAGYSIVLLCSLWRKATELD